MDPTTPVRPQTPLRDAVLLHWIPLGAGSRLPVVRWNGRLFEAVAARRAGRAPQDLYHGALEVFSDGALFVIEMAPAWSRAGVDRGVAGVDRGVVGVGPVGLAWLGRSRLFRYEVRCWSDGVIPDLAWAVGEARLAVDDADRARRVLDLVGQVPLATWGRDELGAGDMWNSNSLVSWLLARAGADLSALGPPPNGRAPGWRAGLTLAARQQAGLVPRG